MREKLNPDGQIVIDVVGLGPLTDKEWTCIEDRFMGVITSVA
jgi:hypothetical protein